MYDFVDTTETGGSNSLPAEAMSVNGTYIENEIDGYRTLHVTGREMLESEISEIEPGAADGTRFVSRRKQPREIVVTYRLMSDSPESFREKYNELNRILDQDEATLVFADEPDKHFTGSLSEFDEVDGGLLNVTGEFVMYCADPFKYGEEVTASLGTLTGTASGTVNAEGTCETPCIIEITPNNALTSLTISGAARDPITGEAEDITITGLESGVTLTIDGEACTVTAGGENKFADTDMWQFPTLQPGRNTLTFTPSSSVVSLTINVTYKPRYI